MRRRVRVAALDLLDRLAEGARMLERRRVPGVRPLARCGQWLYRRLLPRRPTRTAHGFEMHIHQARDGINDFIARTGTYEPATTRIFQEILEPGDRVVDAGAHVGFFSLLSARQVGPEGRVFAFEPAPENHRLLCRNIRLNGLTNVEATAAALWSRDGVVPLHLRPQLTGGHSVAARDGVAVSVPALRLDSFLDDRPGPIRLVKIDVEGAEIEVLKGMTGTIQSSPRLKIVMEFYPRLLRKAGVDPEALLELLASDYGLRVEACVQWDRASPTVDVDRLGAGHANLLLGGV